MPAPALRPLLNACRLWGLAGIVLIAPGSVWAADPAPTPPADPAPAPPAVPLLPSAEAAPEWPNPLSLTSPYDETVIATLRCPVPPVLRMGSAPEDDLGMKWHFELPEFGGWADLSFRPCPDGAGMPPLAFFRSTTIFDEDAVALRNDDTTLEVESPVRIAGVTYRGLFRAVEQGNQVVFAAFALPDVEDTTVREAGWASLRRMFEPPPVKAAAPPADPAPAP
ncbi:MAG: hypothetical protein ABI743_07950 [bacterium]